MATAEQHREWAASNERLYRAIDANTWPDWAVTIIFYALVHEVSAFLRDKRNTVPRGHRAMKDMLASDPSWTNLLAYYEGAQDDSTKTRYRCYRPSEHEVKLAESRLPAVRAEIRRLS